MNQQIFTDQLFNDFIAHNSLESDFSVVLDSDNKPKPQSGNFASAFGSAYKNYSLTGIVLGATNGAEAEAGIISFLSGLSGEADRQEFAQILADYWSTVCIIPGAPTHGGVSVQSVVNDASSKVSAFRSAIDASITDQMSIPIYNQFINNIESIAVSTIIWTVTEMMPVGNTLVPTPFMETIT